MVGGVGVEIQEKKRPQRRRCQLTRYASCPQVERLVVLAPRRGGFAQSIGGKPVTMMSLEELWGLIASMTMDMTTEMTTEEKKKSCRAICRMRRKNGTSMEHFPITGRSKCWTIKGEPVRDGNGGAAFSGQPAVQRRGKVYGKPANHRRCELADDALSAGNRAERPRALGERWRRRGNTHSARRPKNCPEGARAAGGTLREAAGIPKEGLSFLLANPMDAAC